MKKNLSRNCLSYLNVQVNKFHYFAIIFNIIDNNYNVDSNNNIDNNNNINLDWRNTSLVDSHELSWV